MAGNHRQETVTRDFANPEIAPDSLPAAESVDWQSLDPRFVRRLQAGALIRTLVFGAIGAAAHLVAANSGAAALLRIVPWLFPAAWTIYALLSVRALLWPIVAVPRRGYAMREKDILYRSGVFWRSAWAVPFNRVQHTQIDSTPLDRRFALASLSVFPAGGGGQEIPGLGEAMAGRLRAYISARIEDEAPDEAPNDEAAATPAEPGATMETEATDPAGDDPS